MVNQIVDIDRLGFEQALLKIVSACNDISSTKKCLNIKNILQMVAEYAGADRSFVIKFGENNATVNMFHLWVAKKKNRKLTRLPDEQHHWLISEIYNKRAVVIHSKDQIPQIAKAEKRYCLDMGIQSFIMLPLVINDSVDGAFGLDFIDKEKSWTEELIVQLKIIAEIMVSNFARWQEEIRFIKEIEFEHVITEIASDFTRTVADQVDSQIEESLHRICKVMHADFATVLLFNDEKNLYYVTHQWPISTNSATPNMPGIAVDDEFPWLAKTLKNSMQITISQLEDFPEEAYKEKNYCKKHNIQSVLWVPFPNEGSINGFIAINTINKQQTWSDDYGQRLKLIGALFAKAVEGKINQEQLRKAQAETAMNRARLVHMSRVQTLNEMTAGIAHEINQPLAAIDNYAQACRRRLESGTDSTVKVHDLVDKISQQSRRAGEVISRLRTMIKKEPMEMQATDINQVVKEAINLANMEKQYRNFDIEVELSTSLPDVMANSIQIQQVLINLIRNAQDAMESIAQQEKHTIIIATKYYKKRFIEVSVSDQGIGIPKEMEDEVFEPFNTTKVSGFGIGLSICRSIVDYHGGKIWFSKQPRRGTTFHFILPV